MDRERVLIGLWAMASACWICLILVGAAFGASQQPPEATLLLALAPPVLTMVCGYLIARIMRPPVPQTGSAERPASNPLEPPALRPSKPLQQDH